MAPEAAAAQTRDRATRILLVDDEPNVRRSLARVLMSEGFDVMTAEDGAAALALLDLVPPPGRRGGRPRRRPAAAPRTDRPAAPP